MSPEYYCFKSIAPGFALFFAGIALKLEKRNGGRIFFFQLLIYVHSCYPWQQTTENKFNA